MKKILSLFLSMFMVLSLFTISVYAQDNTVIPSETDYAMSNSMITGLKQEYLNGLDSFQKQNIQLILPDCINGVNVTGINSKAFSQYYVKDCRFIMLDLSQMNSLKTIGEWAFYTNGLMQGNIVLPETIEDIGSHAFDGCSSLTGDLILPNSLKTIGTYAFSSCKGMKGELVLSNQLKIISAYAFKDASFTGTLNIPSSVEKICDSSFRQSNSYNGFSGKLIIPDSVTTIEKVSFSYQNAITDVQFSKNITSIPESMFRYCKGLNSVLEIPDYIQSIGMNAFSETNLKTVYLPEMLDQNSTTYIIDSPFYNCTNLTAIVCKEKDYQAIKPLLAKYSNVQKKLTYETTIHLQDDNNNLYSPLLKLYNFSYQYVKQDDKSWKSDSQFRLPLIIGNNQNTMKWSVTKGSQVPISETTTVGVEKNLYVIESLVNPTITYSGGIDKVYDGEPATLSVNASHPKYVDIKNAGEGDIVFYYTWKWATIGSSPAIQSGFDLNTLTLTDVYNSSYAISCIVTIQACYVENNIAKTFYSVSHDFSVDIRQSESIVHPVYENTIQYKDGLPDIGLSSGDTKGNITWDKDQPLQEGTHLYKWTFTPESNQVGSTNYKTVQGTAEITAFNPKIFNLVVKDNGFGSVLPAPTYQVTQGENTILTIKPHLGYNVSSVKVNGKECISQLVNQVLNIQNVQSDYVIEIKYEKINVNNIENIIEELPKLSHNQEPTKEQTQKILEAKLSYESLGNLKDDISQETKKEFNNLLMKLPQIQISTESPVAESSVLLDNMSIEDIEVLLNNPDATLSFVCEMNSVSNQTTKEDIKDYASDLIISDCFDVQVTKILSLTNDSSKTVLSQLKSPIQLILTVPAQLPPLQKNHHREYYVIRIHEDNGQREISILENESLNDSQIVVSTDKFSIYAVAYKDVEDTYDSTLPELPSNPNLPQPPIIKPQPPNDSVTKDTVVATNDTQNMTLWLVIGIGSLVIAIAFVVMKKKK